jgi:methyl-accepting chemotaxis protein
MKIAHKLYLLIAIGFFGCLLIGSTSLFKMAGINENIIYITDNSIPSIRNLNQTEIHFLTLRTYILSHITFSEDARSMRSAEQKLRDYEKLIEQEKAVIKTKMTEYETQFVSDDREATLYQKIKNAMAAYELSAKKIVDISSTYESKKARSELAGLQNVSNAVIAALQESIEYNNQKAAEDKSKGSELYKSARSTVIISSVGVLACLLSLGLLSVNQIRRGVNGAQQTIARIEQSLDFTLRADDHGNDEISLMLRSFNHLISGIQNNLKELLQGVHEVNTTAEELLQSAHQVTDSSQTQSASSAHMAASVEEMTVSINQVAEQAADASACTSDAGLKAQNGQRVIDKTVDNIHAIERAVDTAASDITMLEEKSHEIASVINVIRDVAEQTNLLALNAAIEAARAGEQGRGFAVVADEVRNLAARTATSTVEIGKIISAIQNVSNAAVARMKEAVIKVEEGVMGASEARSTMTEICEVTGKSLELVAHISDAIREQGIATDSIAQQVESVAGMAEENSESARNSDGLANRLEKVAANMEKIVSAYRL